MTESILNSYEIFYTQLRAVRVKINVENSFVLQVFELEFFQRCFEIL